MRAFVAGVAKAIEWTRTTPHDQIIARYTSIISARHRNETTDSLRFWRSAGVATKGGLVQDSDFSRWADWLAQTGSVPARKLDVASLYTNSFNPYAKASS